VHLEVNELSMLSQWNCEKNVICKILVATIDSDHVHNVNLDIGVLLNYFVPISFGCNNLFFCPQLPVQPAAPVLLPAAVGPTTIYRARLANGLQTHVIPVPANMANRLGLPDSNFFRPVSPHGHIYMEIDPVYARLGPPSAGGRHTLPALSGGGDGDRYSGGSTESSVGSEDQQLASDLSDDDNVQQQLQRRLQQRYPVDINGTSSSAEASRQSSTASQAARFAEDRPLIRNNTLRRSAPLRSCHNSTTVPAVSTIAGICHSSSCAARTGGSVRAVAGRQRDTAALDPRHFETPITIALGGAGLTRGSGMTHTGGGLTRGSGMTQIGVSREDLWLADGATHQRTTPHRRTVLNQQLQHFPATHGCRP
jgi:hypothetical protein